MPQKKTQQKRKLGKAEILTSTPIKIEQHRKFDDAKTKELKIETKKTKVAESKKRKIEKQYNCQICSQLYEEINGKPIENWIRCEICKNWCHEACSAYEGIGIYKCDFCE